MRVGDSLTVGLVTLDGGALAKELDAKWPSSWTCVGSVTSSSGGHEGHGGWRIGQIAAQIDSWLSSSSPTDVSLMIGTNDAFFLTTPEQALAELRTLVTKIAKSARVTLSTIPPLPGRAAWQAAYNAGIVTMVSQLRAEGVPVVLADVDRALSTDDLSPDKVHLSAAGYAKMGRAIGLAMTSSPTSTSGTSSSSSSGAVVIGLLAVFAWMMIRKGRR
jgi:lysophospholipase L1-like esterase